MPSGVLSTRGKVVANIYIGMEIMAKVMRASENQRTTKYLVPFSSSGVIVSCCLPGLQSSMPATMLVKCHAVNNTPKGCLCSWN